MVIWVWRGSVATCISCLLHAHLCTPVDSESLVMVAYVSVICSRCVPTYHLCICNDALIFIWTGSPFELCWRVLSSSMIGCIRNASYGWMYTIMYYYAMAVAPMTCMFQLMALSMVRMCIENLLWSSHHLPAHAIWYECRPVWLWSKHASNHKAKCCPAYVPSIHVAIRERIWHGSRLINRGSVVNVSLMLCSSTIQAWGDKVQGCWWNVRTLGDPLYVMLARSSHVSWSSTRCVNHG